MTTFCDFCECSDCKKGAAHLSHAKTTPGRWICDVCYTYDECVRRGSKKGPCDDKNCVHRPKLEGKWEKLNDTRRNY